MSAIEGIPLLTLLPKVERAKLITELDSRQLPVGQWTEFTPNDQMCTFIKQGQVEVGLRANDRWVGLMTLGSGQLLEAGLPVNCAGAVGLRSAGGCELVCLPKPRFDSLIAENPRVMQEYTQMVLDLNQRYLAELARTKSMFMAYAEELWSTVDESDAANADIAPSVMAPLALPVSRPEPVFSANVTRKFLWSLALAIIPGMAAYLHGFSRAASLSLGILIWAVVSWLLDGLPDHVVALGVAGATAALSLVPTEVAFSGFANKTWVLLLAVLGIALAVSRTGLLYRAALHMLTLLPPTYGGQSLALGLVGLVLAPFLPGVTGRQAITSRLALELAEAMRFRPFSRGSAGLAMITFISGSCLYFVSMTGASPSLLVYSYMPASIKASVTWGSWLMAALPATVIVMFLAFIAIRFMFPPEHNHPIAASVIKDQLGVLGPMSTQEKVTLWVVAALVLGLLLQPLIPVDPTWVALAGFLVLIVSGVLDKEAIRRGIDWPFLLLIGALLGITATLEQTGVIKELVRVLSPLMTSAGARSSWVLLPGVALLTAITRTFIPSHSAIMLLTITLTPIATGLGYNPFVIGVVVLMMGSVFHIPQGNSGYLAAYAGAEGRAFSHAQVRPFAYAYILIVLAAVVLSVPYWLWLKLVPW